MKSRDFGLLFRAERRRRGWSQGQAGQHFGVDQSTIAKWELGKQPPTAARFPAVAEFLTLPVGDLHQVIYRQDDGGVSVHEQLAVIQRFVEEQRAFNKRLEAALLDGPHGSQGGRAPEVGVISRRRSDQTVERVDNLNDVISRDG
jgi:transcriptional regulator with XRE-family HTH domain